MGEQMDGECARIKLLQCAQESDEMGKEDRCLKSWLKQNFHTGVNARKKKLLGSRYWYPLHDAVKQQDTYIVELLIQRKADAKQKDSTGKTLFDMARMDVKMLAVLGDAT